MTPERESDIEAYLVKKAKAAGGEVRKVQWVGRDGAPDRIVMLPAPPLLHWCKGIAGLAHRSFDKSEFNTGRRFCPKCGVQDCEAAGRSIWIELKRPGGKAKFPSNPHERKQAREHERMRAMGQRVEVIDSFEGVDALFI